MNALQTKQVGNTVFHTPIINAGQIDVANVAALILRNAGDTIVNLDGGAWTLEPGETLSLNVLELAVVLDIFLRVSFDTSVGSIKKLQYLTIKTTC